MTASVILYGCVHPVYQSDHRCSCHSGNHGEDHTDVSYSFHCGGGIPGSGIVKLLVMVTAFGLPTEIVGIIAAFYRLFDMGTTTNNCLGDLAGTVFVSKLEDKAAARAKSA